MQRLQRSQGDGQLADVFGSLGDGQDDLLPVGGQVGGATTDVQMREICLCARKRSEHPTAEKQQQQISGHL